MLRFLAFALVPLALVSGTAAAGGGPAPGVQAGWDGALDPVRGLRYVAFPAANATTVAAVRRRDGRVLRFSTIRGAFGIPLVAFDGTAEGLTKDGQLLVLADVGVRRDETRFALLQTRTLRLRKTIVLPGLWSFDALSPDGRMLYAIQYLSRGPNPRYDVRAISLRTGRPVGGAIVDKREPDEEMNGAPWARVRSRDGAWAYTLYVRPDGTGFVHALDTARRRAFCVDLPWKSATLATVRLSLERGGRSLALTHRSVGRVATIDTQTYRVRTVVKRLP